MSSIRNSRRACGLTSLLVLTFVAPLLPMVVPSAHAEDRVRKALLFPVTDESSSGLPELRKTTTDALQMAIDALNGMECTEFARSSPMVRRAASEGRVLPTQIETGPSDPRAAIAIGRALGVDTVVIASIQSYRSTQDPRSVEVILSGQAYDVKPNYSEESGDAVAKPSVAQAFGVVGTSRKLPGYRGSDRPLAREAAEDAAYRVAKVLNGASISEVAKPKPAMKSRTSATKWLAVAAAVGLLAWAVSSSGGSGNNAPSPDAIPPTPLPLQAEGSDTIRIRWVAPTGTTMEVLRYELQRSVDGGTFSYFGTGNSSRFVDRASTEFPDFDVSTGHSFRYRMRVIYTNQKFSVYVNFTGITL